MKADLVVWETRKMLGLCGFVLCVSERERLIVAMVLASAGVAGACMQAACETKTLVLRGGLLLPTCMWCATLGPYLVWCASGAVNAV